MMATTLAISNPVLHTVTSGSWETEGIQGFLIGPTPQRGIPESITQIWLEDMLDPNDLQSEIEKCLAHFPGGFSVVGFVIVSPPSIVSACNCEDDKVLGSELLHACPVNYTDQLGLTIVAMLCINPSENPVVFDVVFLYDDGRVIRIECFDDPRDYAMLRFRLKADIPIQISPRTNSEGEIKQLLDKEQNKLLNHLQANNFVFGLCDNTILMQGPNTVLGTSGWSTCLDIVKHFGIKRITQLYIRRKELEKQAPIPLSLFQLASNTSQTQGFAPVIIHHAGSFHSTQVSLPLDVFVEVVDTISIEQLISVINKAVARQISACFDCLNVYTQADKLHTPEVFHFHNEATVTPLTVIYPKGASEHELESERKIMHHHFGLPLTSPYLRRGSAGLFLDQKTKEGYLLNPHIGVPRPQDMELKMRVVTGYYTYHHYMQDHFNDDKWGCAYRSLQTIISWFKYQGYTEKNIPSHREIQQALYDVGDKDQKFVGSKKWIGSFEVSYVLDHLLGVTSKFINVNAGSELASTGQELMNHFNKQSTPVMIGGGVLAHTILGVAYSETTGNIHFLILDPHYTGGEDLRTIQEKGWCGWKDMSFWNPTAHYNLCLPQRPQVF